MFDTETMAELYVKQGLAKKALDMYQRLVLEADDEITRARRRQRIGELEQIVAAATAARASASASSASESGQPGDRAPAFTPPPPETLARPEPKALPLPGVHAEWDRRHTTITWRLPADTVAPALDLLLLMRTPAGIITERRTLPLATAEGRTALPVPDLYAVRVAAGRLEGERFVPIVRCGTLEGSRAPRDGSPTA
ncbi:MAG TPA: hypothetical protein VH374_01425 [Polyangia bacterium]|jgi:hypothetical protein|nr:hypothetical protein [Polyangia bacterium]